MKIAERQKELKKIYQFRYDTQVISALLEILYTYCENNISNKDITWQIYIFLQIIIEKQNLLNDKFKTF